MTNRVAKYFTDREPFDRKGFEKIIRERTKEMLRLKMEAWALEILQVCIEQNYPIRGIKIAPCDPSITIDILYEKECRNGK